MAKKRFTAEQLGLIVARCERTGREPHTTEGDKIVYLTQGEITIGHRYNARSKKRLEYLEHKDEIKLQTEQMLEKMRADAERKERLAEEQKAARQRQRAAQVRLSNASKAILKMKGSVS